jgi:hypothetical protein
MSHRDPVVATFFDEYGIGPEVSSKGEMEELKAISVALVQDALADIYKPGAPATLFERAAITCVVFVVCDCVADQLTLDDGSHVHSSDLGYAVWPHVMSHHPDPDPDADAKSTFGTTWADSFQQGLLWSSKIEAKSKELYAAAVALGESSIALFRDPRNSECVVRLRKAAFQFMKELIAATD